jgi:TolB-like protein/DNA-binding winged helix-turn-helix (wHTH) protein/Tfp pilus assembly protein PilF
MATAPAPNSVLRFGAFELDATTGEVRKHGLLLKLHPQPAKVLILLASRPNQLVTREEIKEALWGQETFVDFEQGLNSCVRQIRSVLADDPDNPRFVQTVPRRGYRFIAPVASGNGIASAASAVPVPQVLPQKSRVRWRVLLLASSIALVLTALAAFYYVNRLAPAARSATKIMLAVLPFENYSPDAEREYLADGLTEEMITQLGSLEPERLGVIARTSAMKYKGARVAVDQIGKELGVDYVLEGSIRTEADRVRVTAQLIRVKDQTHIWARSYERTHGGILTMQQEVSNAIANEIQIELTPQHRQRLAALQFSDPRAHEAYARGRYFWNKRTNEDLATAIQYFEQVLQYEPGYALAYSGLADAYFYRSYAFGNVPPHEGMPKARAAALKALELDPDLAEAHTSMALVKFFYDWDWPGAEAEFKRAIELNPNYPTAHHGYAVLLLTVYGRWEDAIVEANRALELDPLSVPLNNIVALILVHSPQHDQVIERAKKLQEQSPNYSAAYAYISAAYEAKGLHQEAVEASLKAHTLDGFGAQNLARMKNAYESGGITAYWRTEADIVIKMASKQAPHAILDRLRLVDAYIHIGNRDAALDILENICEERSGMSVWTKISYADSPLMRSDPRFQALLRRIGLPQ